MMTRNSTVLALIVAVGLGIILVGSRVPSHGAPGGGQMMGPGQQMPMGPMMGQMQQQMNQMTTNLRAMRAQLDKVNPDLLTAQQRPMYEYLKLLQRQIESMHGMMGMMQGAMGQMPATTR
jgi:hypothetical protein